MAAQSYQITRNVNDPTQQRAAFEVLSSVAINAIEGYHFTIQDVSMDGSGRLRVRLSSPFPQAEVDSFAGDIIAV